MGKDLGLHKQNLESFAATVKVEVMEKDPDQEITVTEGLSSKAATSDISLNVEPGS